MFEYDRVEDEHGLPKNVFAMSTCISKRVKWLMDTESHWSSQGWVSKDGYAFRWMPGKLPFMVTPKQGFVHLQVKDDIPHLVSDGKLRSNRHRPTIDDLKGHFSEVLALVTNDEAGQNDDDDENDIPAAVGESAEVEGERHHGAFDFGPPGAGASASCS